MPDVSIGAAPLLELMGAVFRSVPVDVYIQKTMIATAAAAIVPSRLVDDKTHLTTFDDDFPSDDIPRCTPELLLQTFQKLFPSFFLFNRYILHNYFIHVVSPDLIYTFIVLSLGLLGAAFFLGTRRYCCSSISQLQRS